MSARCLCLAETTWLSDQHASKSSPIATETFSILVHYKQSNLEAWSMLYRILALVIIICQNSKRLYFPVQAMDEENVVARKKLGGQERQNLYLHAQNFNTSLQLHVPAYRVFFMLTTWKKKRNGKKKRKGLKKKRLQQSWPGNMIKSGS